jgi:hypothetical protein
VRQGRIGVSYVDGRARVLETTSPRYRTPDGIHVGLRVHGMTCRDSDRGVCNRGFSYDDCTHFFSLRVANGAVSVGLDLGGGESGQLSTKGGTVRRIFFGDENVLLTCF